MAASYFKNFTFTCVEEFHPRITLNLLKYTILMQNTHVLLSKLYVEFNTFFRKGSLKKLKILLPLFMGGVHLCKGYKAIARRQSTFYHSVPRSSCTYLIDLGRMKH